MVGLIASRLSEGEQAVGAKQTQNLTVEYLRHHIFRRDMKDYAPLLLERMVTNAGTRAPKSVEALSAETGFTPAQVKGILNLLAKEGLVRLLDPQDQIWEISHDFIAHHVLQVLRSRRRSVFEAARPWLAPSAVILWGLVLFIALPPYVTNLRDLGEAQAALAQRTQEEEALQAVAEMGVMVLPVGERDFSTAILSGATLLSTVTPEDALMALSKATSVGGLAVMGLTLNDECYDLIAEMTWLKRLEIKPFSSDVHDLPVGKMTCLENLVVSGSLSHQDLVLVTSQKTLKGLYLEDCRIVDEDLPLIASMTSLETLSLNGNGITDAGLAHLSGLTSLRSLDLGSTRIMAGGLQVLGGLSSLEHLDLSNLDIGNEGLRQLPKLSSLTSLSLGNCRIDDSGLACLSGLSTLEKLWVQNNRITDAGLASLGGLTSLTLLGLESNNIGGDGLASVSKLKSLEFLLLSENHIAGPTLIHLGELDSLTYLTLDGNDISDSDLVEYLKGPPTLSSLTVERPVSPETMAALQERMPSLQSCAMW
jgi:Leucine-rich repeat (LRR) protein